MPDTETQELSPYWHGPMWNWFELSYSNYLVLPRTLLCGMPADWQARMVDLLDEMRATYRTDQIKDEYIVTLRQNGKFIKDPLGDYRHPQELPYQTQEKDV